MGQTSASYSAYRDLREAERSAWGILCRSTSPWVLAVLGSIFGDARRIGQVDLIERLGRELAELAATGVSVNATDPGGYLNQWVTQGYVTRTMPLDATDEQCELSSEAWTALHFVESLRNPRSATNDSRLTLLIEQLEKLAEESDESAFARIEAKRAEIRRLEEEIGEIAAGRARPITERQALDRLRTIDEIRGTIVGDFGKVRRDLVEVNAELIEKLHGNEASRGKVVAEILEGVDQVALSPAGRTAQSFYRLISNEREMARLSDAITIILSRPFAGQVNVRVAAAWRQLPKVLLDEADSNNDVMNALGRNLKTYVTSREYRQYRQLNELIRETRALALKVSQTSRSRRTAFVLDKTGCVIEPVTRWYLRDASQGVMDGAMREALPAELDLEELARSLYDADIDFAWLRRTVDEAVAARGQISIRELLEGYPVPQGLATAIGYLHLAIEAGAPDMGELEEAAITIGSEWGMRLRLPKRYFIKGVSSGN